MKSIDNPRPLREAGRVSFTLISGSFFFLSPFPFLPCLMSFNVTHSEVQRLMTVSRIFQFLVSDMSTLQNGKYDECDCQWQSDPQCYG